MVAAKTLTLTAIDIYENPEITGKAFEELKKEEVMVLCMKRS